MSDDTFEPKIVGFLCNWCSYRAADLAGSARIKHASNVRIIRVMCSGRVDPNFVLQALSQGADGVLIAGCHPGECHYINQNYKTMRRFIMLKHVLRQLGLEDGYRVVCNNGRHAGQEVPHLHFHVLADGLANLDSKDFLAPWTDILTTRQA